MDKDLYDAGMKLRREVVGAEYVDKAMAAADDLTADFQDLVTEYCWGAVWTREGLSHRDRSVLNLGMLTALGKPNELKLHLRGALKNGVTRDEIREIFIQTAVYCGVPAALEAFRMAREVFDEADA
ncbi:MAG: 4-carboxymuconolactone decarboxylase [Gammaproteobacteria bacterium]|jgi:4-carboxymuconolactone decarboxylase